jgi:hypothetical protein
MQNGRPVRILQLVHEALAEASSALGSAGSQHFAVLTDTERATLAELLAKLEARPTEHGH